MIQRLPTKVRENSPIAHVRSLQRAVNELVDAVRAREIQQSPNTRIERLPGGGVTVHTQGGGTTTTSTVEARWL